MKAGWKLVKLGELCNIKTGKKDVNEGCADGLYPFFTCAATHTYSNVYSFDTEALLIAGNGDVGRVSYYKGKFEAYQRTYVLSGFTEVLPRFLFLILDGKLKERVSKQKLGNTMPYIKMGMLTDFVVPVPPLPEQQRIVSILDEAFAGIATARTAAEQNRQNARALFESHLQSVFSQRGEGWVEKTLEEAVDSQCSLSYGIVQPGEDQPDGLPIVRPTDLGGKTIELDGLKRIDPSLADSYRRTTLRGDDLLLCVRGSTGMISVASHALAGGNVTRGIVPIHFDDTLVTQNFGYYLMRSDPVQQQIRKMTYGAALMQINIRDLRNLILLIPPRSAQAELADRFESLQEETQRLEALYQRKLEALDELKQSLLHQAFSGQL